MDNHIKKMPGCRMKRTNIGTYGESIEPDWKAISDWF